MHTSFKIGTDRLQLRPFTPEDSHHLFELDSDPEVMRYLTGGAGTPLEVIESEILPRFLRGGYWAAIEKSKGDFIGWFSLRAEEGAPTHFVLGYRLRRVAWGKGYATEGCRALIALGFEQLGAERIAAHTYEENLASRRVMEKLGMRYVRAYRLTMDDLQHIGTFDPSANELWDGDDVEYAITREERSCLESARG